MTGVGKTSIGRRLADLLGAEFLDTDAEVSRQCHMSITDFWERHGEDAFRRLERQAVQAAVRRERPTVIATGGGAILSKPSRDAMRDSGTVVWIEKDLDQLAHRLRTKKRRPVLDGDLRQRLGELMAQRRNLYDEVAHVVVDTSNRTKADVAAEIAEVVRTAAG